MTRVIETPVEFAGKWVAWNEDHSKIIASGDTMEEAKDNAMEKGIEKFWLDKVPSDQKFFSGAAIFQ